MLLTKICSNATNTRMNGSAYLRHTVKGLKLNASTLSKKAGWTANMVWQLSNSIRAISPEQAVSLEIASDGAIDASKACPDFFERLKAIGFERKQGGNEKESPEHGKEATSIEAGAVQCELAPQHGQAA